MEDKYRAWDRTSNKDGVMVEWEELKKFPCEYVFMNLLEVNLMQFTGKPDINGKDIYQNDILKGRMDDAGFSSRPSKEATFVVKRRCGEWGYYFYLYQLTGKSDYHHSYPSFDECEIIGDSYRNPELMVEE
jgi:uncharacterized phage protein (TIGR01671 family)